MTVKTLIQEAINKNALGFEQSLKEELRNRVALALEAKMKSKDEDEEGEEESDDTVKESAQLDEISLKLAADYTLKASDASRNKDLPLKKKDQRVTGVYTADQKVRKMHGLSSKAKVPTTTTKE